MAERTWPSDIEPRTKEGWLEAANSGDPNEMQLIGAVLKKLKFSARDYVTWPKEKRIETIIKHQPDGGGEGEEPKKKKGAARGGLGRKKKGAAKPQGGSTAAAKTAPASSGGGGMSTEQFDALLEAIGASNTAVGELTEKLEELETKLETVEALVTETHFGFTCIALGDETIRGNFEDPAMQEELLGELSILGGDEEEEGEE